ncbi:MAG: DUF2520 domain-containing protein [Lachnospiraceae bacterium]|nr:DUF2520 domain-containing protein [Lachnospiraceae bacterium]
MKIGFVGAGRAGCSLGKYFTRKAAQADVTVTGYNSIVEEEARWAAEFTSSSVFERIEDVIAASDAIILSTPDGAIKKVWDTIDKKNLTGKMICHLSGSLSSDVFSGIDTYGGYAISIHPMFAFSNKDSVYQQLDSVSFTLEGHPYAVNAWQQLLDALGNCSVVIDQAKKPKYHAAASILSNQVVAVLATGYELLEECGFSEKEARTFSAALVRDNVEHVIADGCVSALTGPIERGDVGTVQKHLQELNDTQKELYRVCGSKLLELAGCKNPQTDYAALESVLKEV